MSNAIQFTGHQTFTLRHSWLPKVAELLADGPNSLKPEEAMVSLGVGKNMVEAIKYWLVATQVAERQKDGTGYSFTPWGEKHFHPETGEDPFLEDPASLWMLHWNIASQPNRCGSLYYLFNEIGTSQFSEEMLVAAICEWARRKEQKVSVETVQRDVNVVLRSYVPPRGNSHAEDVYQCPLNSLQLIRQPSAEKEYHFNLQASQDIPSSALLHALSDTKSRMPGVDSIAFDTLAFGTHSLGSIFKVTAESLYLKLELLAQTGQVDISESSGVRNIRLLDQKRPNNEYA